MHFARSGKPSPWRSRAALVVALAAGAFLAVPGAAFAGTSSSSATSVVAAAAQPSSQSEGAAVVTTSKVAMTLERSVLVPTAAAGPAIPKMPRDNSSCNTPFPGSAGQCLIIHGYSNYIYWIQVKIALNWPQTVRGHIRVYTVYSAYRGINFNTNTFSCHDGWTLPRQCWNGITYWFRVWLPLHPGARAGFQRICAVFYYANGKQADGPTCADIHH